MSFTICLYLLKLGDGMYYVGHTDHMQKRFGDHVLGADALWTIHHKPLELLRTREIVIESSRQAAMYENWMTLHYMEKFGRQNVRGGEYHMVEPCEP